MSISWCFFLLAILMSRVEVTMTTRLFAGSDVLGQKSDEDEPPSVDKQDCLAALLAHITIQEEDAESGLDSHVDGNDMLIRRRCNLEVNNPPTPGYGSSSVPPSYGQSPAGPSLLPSPPPSRVEPSSLPSPSPSPSLSPSPFMSPTSSKPPPVQEDSSEDITPPYCEATSSSVTCLSINGTRGKILDAFLLTADGWKSGSATFPNLAYEFGVLATSGTVLVHKPRQPYSGATTATIAGIMPGKTSLYVCVISTNLTSMAVVGPRTCATVDVQVNSAEIPAAQLKSEIAAIKSDITSSTSKASTINTVGMAKRLAAIASVATTSSSTVSSIKVLASDLLGKLLGLPGNDTSGTSPVLMIFDGLSTLWSLASIDSRAASLVGVSMLSEKLALQQLTVEDAQPVADFFNTLVGDAMEMVNTFASSSANNGNSGNSGGAARALAAHDVFTSIVLSADALTRGMSNKVACNGSVASVMTPLVAASAKCTTANLTASGGLTMSLLTPGSSAIISGQRLRLLLASDFNANAPVTMSLNPVIGPLCVADTSCASVGLRVTVTILIDTSLLVTSFGGSVITLVANLSDYRHGGTAEIVSPIVRVAAQGLPLTAIGISGLATIGIPLNSTAVATKGAKTTRAVVRLQDFGAAPVDLSAGISPSISTTYIVNAEDVGISGNLLSFTSNYLGDFVVVQYDSTATPTSGASSSLPELGSSITGAAEIAQQPCVLTTCALAIAAIIFAFVL